jgi:hypothetical protein
MEETKLSHILQALPRERARGSFTAQVLRRLDEQPASRAARLREASRLQRFMLATATVGVVSLSIALLPREHTPLPLSVSLVPSGEKLAATLQPFPAHRLSAMPLEAQQAMSRPMAGLDPAEAHQMVQQLRQESSRLEHELHSLRLPAGRAEQSPSTATFVGEENLDLTMSPGRARTVQAMPAADRDDGEFYNLLD